MAAYEDERTIKALNGDRYTFASVGNNGVTRIRAVKEPGEMAHTTSFEVYVEGMEGPKKRVNGRYVSEIIYADPNDPWEETP